MLRRWQSGVTATALSWSSAFTLTDPASKWFLSGPVTGTDQACTVPGCAAERDGRGLSIHTTTAETSSTAATTPDRGYADTTQFYRAAGFRPLEETRDLWPGTPCLIMVKALR
ncbi:hypothetical protein GCM10010492_59430 [Saccharothrix mutabilis subsp. mutabilis]|uniref:Acetyltransferase n=1 Tax=Saccharothrix mutabilis subsp. mutabilis TaxID=66855 RepID=A0ABP3E6X6_9PSEU